MTIREAKETLEKYDYSTKLELSEGIRNNITSGITVDQFFVMKETCIELLDKATPKKPPKHDKVVCPTCNSKANYGHPYTNFCCHCGQMLDLSKGEKIKEYISAIQNNYPPANYTLLREALDYCLELLKEKEME